MRILSILIILALVLGGCASASSSGERSAASTASLSDRDFTESVHLPLLDSATRGDVNAAIVIVEFVAFPCQDCSFGSEAIAELLQERDDVQHVFKHMPRDEQPETWMAARMLEAAGNQGKFWEMHALLMERMDELTPGGTRELAPRFAEELNLNLRRFRADLESLELSGRIERDQRLGQSLNVRTNPTYFVNGQLLAGPRRARHFQAAITQVQRMNDQLAAMDVPPRERYAGVVAAFRAQQREEERYQNDEDIEVMLVDTSNASVLVQPDDLVYGPGAADDFLVTVVEFSSLQCPFAADAAETMRRLSEHYDGRVRFVFKHFPVDMHAQSVDASAALIAAQRQGRGLEMLHAIYDAQGRLTQRGVFEDFAADLGLDLAQFRQVYNDRATLDRVWESRDEGEAVGVVSTPEFFINGIRVSGAHPFEHFRRIIDSEIERAEMLQEEMEIHGDDLYRALIERRSNPD